MHYDQVSNAFRLSCFWSWFLPICISLLKLKCTCFKATLTNMYLCVIITVLSYPWRDVRLCVFTSIVGFSLAGSLLVPVVSWTIRHTLPIMAGRLTRTWKMELGMIYICTKGTFLYLKNLCFHALTCLEGPEILIVEISRSRSDTPHSGWRIDQLQRPLLDNTPKTHRKQTSMPPAGFKPAIPPSARP
jgi:hypothetical protein